VFDPIPTMATTMSPPILLEGKNTSSNIDGVKVIIIGTGEFGTAVAQSTQIGTIPFSNKLSSSAMHLDNVNVVHVSARAFILNQTVNEMADVIANSCYIMYCGSRLTQHSRKIADVMIKARTISTKEPLVDFIDWSNPDPGVDGSVNSFPRDI
jgi:hypothetical protein